MFAIIGLGNPGERYEGTRHNVGFHAIDELLRQVQFAGSLKNKFGNDYAKVDVGLEDVLLIKPQEYMNLSGQSAKQLLSFFKIPVENTIVIYDEVDLPPGALRLRSGGSAGGHNGIKDLISHLGTQEFTRVRIGVGHPKDMEKTTDLSKWVLAKPGPKDKELLDKTISLAAQAAIEVVKNGLKSTQQKFNKKQ